MDISFKRAAIRLRIIPSSRCCTCMAVNGAMDPPEILEAAFRLDGKNHGEQVLLRKLKKVKNLENMRVALYTTLQPCNWCAGSISQNRVFDELFYIWNDRNYPLAQEALFFATKTGPFPWHVGDLPGAKFPSFESMTNHLPKSKNLDNWAPSSSMHRPYGNTKLYDMDLNLNEEETKLAKKILELLN
eukprot:Rmarinus@m.15723